MPANWYLPSSATATLTVGVARAEVVDFRVTPAAEQGEIIGPTTEPVAIGVRNVGSLAGSISLRIRDLDGDVLWTGSITLGIDAGVNDFGWIYPPLNYPMPSHDLRLRAEAYHDSIVDDYLDKTITLIVKVNTATTLTLDPSSVEPGGMYHYKGKLTRTDTGAGLGGMEIIARREGVEMARGITDSAGNYDIAVTAPTTTGAFNCQAVFPGVVPFAASSAQAGLGVGMAVIEPIWIAAGATTLGITLVMLGLSK